MPCSRKQFEEWVSERAAKQREWDDCARVLASGMPQATEHERRSLESRYVALQERIRVLDRWMKQAPFKINKKSGQVEHR